MTIADLRLTIAEREVTIEGLLDEVERLRGVVNRLQGVANLLADDLARYNGTTVPETLEAAIEQERGVG